MKEVILMKFERSVIALVAKTDKASELLSKKGVTIKDVKDFSLLNPNSFEIVTK